ncbi:16357_t:CDS:2 [Funneliformis caledonium]|uniref:16357_t:CDS:1 n=1 Tax=Funneliformis caledonium TaxID=1117310 RepID=A0A9N9CSN6_9GLOM|nr:16357_t:CDS:2 [Funneliformis caledonium]
MNLCQPSHKQNRLYQFFHPRYTTSSNHCASSTSYSEGSDNEEYKQQNPLDYYTRVSMESIIEEIIQVNNLKYDVRYPFDLNEKRFVAFQVMAENASLAYYNRVCFLNIHEEYGPWIGLRAVITLDMEGPPNSSQLFPELKNPFPEGDKILERKLSEIFGSKDHYYHQQPDDPETMDVNQKDGNNISDMKLEIKNEWYKFVELRDIASRFMDKKSLDNWRYSEDQMEYHYTNNIEFLNNLFN